MVVTRGSALQHNSPKKNRLVGAILGGKNVAESARLMHMPYSTALDIWKKYKKTGSTHNLARSGHPRTVTDHTKRQIVRTATKERRKPFAEIGNQVEPKVSDATVRRVLAEEGYHRRVARKVPYLTKQHKSDRRRWARQYKAADWEKVIWSDECYVHLGRIYVTRRPSEVLLEECLVPTFKQSSVRVMVWGCILKGRKGPLIVLEYPGGRGGGMNSKRYQEQVLDGVLKAFYTRMEEERGSILFQHDGAPSHTSKSTKQWFTRNRIPLLFHPASSPDLNPIEPVWHELKRILRSLPNPPNTVEQLCAAILAAWEDLAIEDVNKHVDRMPDRVEAVVKARGSHTRF